MQIACHLIDGPWLRFFYALPTLIFSVFTSEFRFNEAVNITRSQKLCYSESFTIFPSNLELLSLNDGLYLYFLPCNHAFRKLCKRLHWYWSFINYLSLCLHHCRFPSCAKKLIKAGPKWFYWYSDATVLRCSFKKYKKILIIYLKGPAFRHICTGYTEVT